MNDLILEVISFVANNKSYTIKQRNRIIQLLLSYSQEVNNERKNNE